MKKTISKILAFIIAFTMVVTLIPAIPASAAAKYEVGLHGNGGTMTVTSRGETYTTPETSETSGVEGKCMRDLQYTKVVTKHSKGLTFLGWYPYVLEGKEYKRVSGAKLMTTSEMLDYKFPNKDTMFYAMWGSLEATSVVEPAGDLEIMINGNEGKFTYSCYNGNGSSAYREHYTGAEGLTLRKMGYTKIGTPSHPDGKRFEGWRPMKFDNGNVLRIDGVGYMTSAEILDYEFPDHDIVFYAKWEGLPLAGEDEDNVDIRGNGGEFKVTKDGKSWTATGCGQGKTTKGSTLRAMGYTYVGTPVHYEGTEFLGWYPIKCIDEEHGQWEKIEGTELLTSEEILDYAFPEDNTTLCAKWKGILCPGEKGVEVHIQGKGGTFEVTMDGETWATEGCSRGGAVEYSTLRKMGYSHVSTPVHPDGKVFEGWTAAASLGNGWQVIKGSEYLSTEEILEYPITEKGIMFLARWQGDYVEDIFGVMTGLEIAIQGEGGEFNVVDCYKNTNGWIAASNCSPGATLRKQNYKIADPVHPDGYKFLGWCVYEKEDGYYNKTNKVLTTEQILDYELPSDIYMFVAKWEGIEMQSKQGALSVCVNANGGTVDCIYSDDGVETLPEFSNGYMAPGFKFAYNFKSISDPIHPKGKVFEGWVVYEEIEGTYRNFKILEGQALLTTKEMLEYECTDAGLLFVAKWKGEAVPNAWGNNSGFVVSVDCNGGEAEYTFTNTWSTSGCGRGGAIEGMCAKDIGYSNISIPVHPDGRKFLGWTLYKQEGDEYVKVKGYEKMTTEEMLNYKLTDSSIIFMAQWGCSHSYKTTKTVKATTSKNGSIKQKCSKCGVTKTTTLYKISSVKCNTAKYTYNGKAKTPGVTVKDSKGNTISSKYYTVSYAKGRKTVGRYKVTVKFKTRYYGSKSAYFTIVPKAPSSASATLYGYDDVKFSWKKSTGAKGYSVYYKTATGSYKLLTRTTKTSVKKANLSDGIKYTFKVVPYYKSGSTRYDALTSKTASVYTLKKMAAPIVEMSDDTKVKVSWTDIDGQSGYQISKSTSKTKTSIVVTYGTTSGQSKVLKANKNKKYYYKVRAYKTVGKTKIYGPWSSVTEFIVTDTSAAGI